MNDGNWFLVVCIVLLFLFVVWVWFIEQQFKALEPNPIARERKDLYQKVRIER